MKYDRFEQLPVWMAAVELAEQAFVVADAPALRGRGDTRDQLQRAALSISSNIAEGFERGTTPELISFLYIAKGSAGEVRSMTWVMERIPALKVPRTATPAEVAGLPDLKSEISDLRTPHFRRVRLPPTPRLALLPPELRYQRHTLPQ